MLVVIILSIPLHPLVYLAYCFWTVSHSAKRQWSIAVGVLEIRSWMTSGKWVFDAAHQLFLLKRRVECSWTKMIWKYSTLQGWCSHPANGSSNIRTTTAVEWESNDARYPIGPFDKMMHGLQCASAWEFSSWKALWHITSFVCLFNQNSSTRLGCNGM